jgi:DNA-binding CsgD family transcriptional regulator
MLERTRHYRTATKAELTPRQREVLSLIAGGKTNPEIAEALGISLDGAKFHVREILGKLEVDSREEAAAWWRAQSSVGSRISSVVRALLPATWLKPAIAGAALGGLALASVVVGLALNGGDEDPAALPACHPAQLTWTSGSVPHPDPEVGIRFTLAVRSSDDCELNVALGLGVSGGKRDAQADTLGYRRDSVPITVRSQRLTAVEGTPLIAGFVSNACEGFPLVVLFVEAPGLTKEIWLDAPAPPCLDTSLPLQLHAAYTPLEPEPPHTSTPSAANLPSCDLQSLQWSLASVVDPSVGLRYTWSVTPPSACLLEGEVTVSVAGGGLQVDARNLPPDPSFVSIRQALATDSTPVITGTIRNVCGVPGLAISAAMTEKATISLDAPVPECFDPGARAELTAARVADRTPGALAPATVQPRPEPTPRP